MPVLFFPPRRVIRENKSWVMMAASIFLICTVIFYQTTAVAGPGTGQALEMQMEQLEGFFTFILETNPLIGALLVFMNNFLSMAQMLLLGVVAGISPLLTLGVNGALVGAMLALAAGEGLALLPVVLLGILPHGIFELSAFFLCGAIGLKFGYHCIASPLPGMNRMQSYRYIWKEAISLMPLVVTLLLAAAFIEMLVTPHLLQMIMP